MTLLTRHSSPKQPPAEEILPLENGDRLTRDEFERRYHAMPGVKKAELIEGVVSMPSPVRLKKHAEPHLRLITWIGTYCAGTSGLHAGDNATARLDLDNEPQPDVLLMIDPARGGQARLSADDYVEGPPELVCEIAGSTAAIDLHAKLNAYRRNGVKEYVVWVTGEPELRWYVAREGRFDVLPLDADGITRSLIFPGLWLDSAALLRGDMPRVLEILHAGLHSDQHVQFVKALSDAVRS
jgi:Uma2 family endonuclease